MCLVDGPPCPLVAERVQEADALRNREDEVEAGNGGELLPLDSPLVGVRVDPLDGDDSRLRVATQTLLRQRMETTDQCAQLTL
jgi:hypothetical protein